MNASLAGAEDVAGARHEQALSSLVPQGWRYVRLTSVAKLETGHTPSRRNPSYWNGDIPWVSLLDTAGLNGATISATRDSVTREGIANSSARLLPAGTVIFSRTATVGKSTVMGREMATSQDFANYICGPEVHNHFLVYLFRHMAPEWRKLMAGSIHNTVYMPVFRVLQVLLPSHAEQVAIAKALSDTDALIESLEQLLAKKRQIKQGAMQELLTGQRRLPGFDAMWDERPFDGVLVRVGSKACQIEAGEYQRFGRYPVVDQGQQIVVAFSDRSDRLLRCPPGGLIVFGDHTCTVKFVAFDFIVGADGTQVLRAQHGQCAQFQAFQLQLSGIESTGYNRHFKTLRERTFAVPALSEQAAIATTLSDIDAEITALEARLAKTRLLKQGMAQALLTGRIRLV